MWLDKAVPICEKVLTSSSTACETCSDHKAFIAT